MPSLVSKAAHPPASPRFSRGQNRTSAVGEALAQSPGFAPLALTSRDKAHLIPHRARTPHQSVCVLQRRPLWEGARGFGQKV